MQGSRQTGQRGCTLQRSQVLNWGQRGSTGEVLAPFHKPLQSTHCQPRPAAAGLWAKWGLGVTFLKAIPNYRAFKGLRCVVITPRRTEANWWWVVGCVSQRLCLGEHETHLTSSETEGIFARTCFTCWDFNLD